MNIHPSTWVVGGCRIFWKRRSGRKRSSVVKRKQQRRIYRGLLFVIAIILILSLVLPTVLITPTYVP